MNNDANVPRLRDDLPPFVGRPTEQRMGAGDDGINLQFSVEQAERYADDLFRMFFGDQRHPRNLPPNKLLLHQVLADLRLCLSAAREDVDSLYK